MKQKSSDLLQQKIDLLRMKQLDEIEAIKNSVGDIQHSLRPSNLLKQTMKDITGANDLPETALDTFIALGAGYFANLAVVGTSKRVGVKVLGYLLQYGVSKYLTDHMNTIKHSVSDVWTKLKHKKPKESDALSDDRPTSVTEQS